MNALAAAFARAADGRLALLGWLWRAQARAQPGRALTAVLAIAIGVALALAIHLVNRSALEEFSAAMSTVNGEAQAQVRARAGSFDEALYPQLAAEADGASVSPVIDAVFALADRPGETLRVIGIDAFRAAAVTPALLPSPGTGEQAGAASPLFADDTVFLSNAALSALGLAQGDTLRLRAGARTVALRVAGTLPRVAAGQQLAVMDLGAMQWRLGWLGRLSRLDLHFVETSDAARLRARWQALLPPDAVWSAPDASRQRMSNLSRAYRVNLGMLALVALLTGGYIVHATLALGVARQQRELALLGVLGARPRLLLAQVLGQALLLGSVGAALGALAGVALAGALLAWVGGDLGGGYFAGSRPALALDAPALFGFAGAGLATAVLGAVAPALAASRTPGARALRAGSVEETLRGRGGAAALAWPIGCFVCGAAALALPPLDGIPWPSYAAIAAWLAGGIALVPRVVAVSSRGFARLASSRAAGPIAWLAAHRLRGAPASASAAMSGIVASVALAGAMAIMVSSFRDSVDRWLGAVLPADAYARIVSGAATAAIDPALRERFARAPGVARAEFSRSLELTLDPSRPPLMLIARPIDPLRPQRRLAITGEVLAPPPDTVPVYVSEAAADLYGWRAGSRIALPLPGAAATQRFFVAAIWRDYARQHGAVALDAADYRALTGDATTSDVALWFDASIAPARAIATLREALSDVAGLELRTTGELRALSLRIFDRSFAVTYALEAIAIVVALFGVASAWAAEGLARVREFGMLRHLGLRRREVARLFAAEAALQIGIAAAWGTVLGVMIAMVLVHRVNPQSFHWTMDLSWPVGLLGAAAAALLALGVAAAVLAARSAMSEAPVRALREDW